jgi:hypothetical protein
MAFMKIVAIAIGLLVVLYGVNYIRSREEVKKACTGTGRERLMFLGGRLDCKSYRQLYFNKYL